MEVKTLTEIAKIYRLDYGAVYRAQQRTGIIPALKSGRMTFFDEHQEMMIAENLFHIGEIDCFVYESKINKPDPVESFTDFKKRTYGRK